MEEVDHYGPRPLKRQKASSSQTTPDYASGRAYEVFLNFRGPDSRYTVTDVLYRHLTNARFRVFLDNEDIRKGEVIEGELLAAITNSTIYIPILSKNYASSKWCLRELAKMIECWETSRSSETEKAIFPIFYDVDVSQDVKLRSPLYLIPLQKHKDELGEDIVKPWEDALRKVATIKGWNLKDHGLSELADLITKEVSSKFVTSLPDRLVGIDEPVQGIIEKLDKESPCVRFIVIHGMGGIGKTTLADAVFKKISSDYQGKCFLKDVRRSTSNDGMVKLQEKLLSDTLNQKNEVSDIDDGIRKISRKLCDKNVLVVLDDVDNRDHLLKLAAKSSWFGIRSRIIITTRSTQFLPTKDNKEYHFYEMPKMDSRHALQLFCWHAFEKDKPPHELSDMSTEIVNTTGGLPLSLEVIGSSLYLQDEDIWKFTLDKLKEAPYKGVQDSLMISYRTLLYEQRQIFLDIACFFNGEEMNYPLYFWEACKFYPNTSIKILVKRSLIKVLDNDRLWIHDQLRDFGRAIAHPKELCLESPFREDPVRLWLSDHAFDALRHREVAESIVAIKLGTLDANHRFVPEEFTRARNLKFLELEGGNFEGDFKNVLQQLRWLSWFDFSPRLEAINLSFKNLVILKLRSSNIDEEWGGWSAFMESQHLKVLHLEDCNGLKKTPNFSTLKKLERLILRNCFNLEEIDISIYMLKHLKCLEISDHRSFRGLAQPQLMQGSIGDLKSLEVLEIRYAGHTQLHHSIGKLTLLVTLDLSHSRIKELPDSIGDLKCLKILRMKGTPTKCLPDTIGGLVSLEELYLGWKIESLPETIGNLERLKVIDVSWSRIRMLPKTLAKLGNLERLEASSCRKMDGNLPKDLGKLSHLRILDLLGSPISRLPTTINQLSHLQELSLDGIHEPQELLKLPTSLISLRVFSSSLKSHRIPDLSHMTNLERLRLILYEEINYASSSATSSPCDQTPQMKWLARLTKLKDLQLKIPNVFSPPVEWSCLPRLQSLDINCFDLRSLHPLPSNLDMLTLSHVKSPTDWQCLSSLSNVSTLTLCYCLLKEIKFDCIEHLHSLHLYDCKFLEKVSNLSCLRVLRQLHIDDCPDLVDIEGLGELEYLQRLELLCCSSIRRLPDLSGLKKLEKLEIQFCRSLESLPDVDEEVPCDLFIFDCRYFHDFRGPYSERDRAIKNEDSLSDSDRGSDDGSSNSSSDNDGDGDSDSDSNNDGVYSTVNRPSSLHQVEKSFWKRLCHCDCLPKVKHFVWGAINNALATNFNLYRKGVIISPKCPFCDATETVEHLLLCCPWTKVVWFTVLGLRFDNARVSTFARWLENCISGASGSELSWKRVFANLAIVAWNIWKGRCHSVFSGVPPLVDVIENACKKSI